MNRVNSEGEIESAHEGIKFGGHKIAQVLTLGAGGDNQSHVTRPQTAKPANLPSQGTLKRIDSHLETITEK